MKVLNFGSLNVDYVYSVDHFVMGGETESSTKMEPFCGGKGLNQSIAAAKAGAEVYHAGIIGEDGEMLLTACKENGVDARYIKKMPVKGGHTIIQVDRNGQNCILLYPGTNGMMTEEFINEVFNNFETGDILMLQNEVNMVGAMIDKAYEKGMKIVLNPSPYDARLNDYPLEKVSLFILNEIEGKQCTGKTEPKEIIKALHEKYPKAEVVLTLGEDGAMYDNGSEHYEQGIFKTKVVDTTAAGDTFTGYFLASVIKGKSPAEALRTAAMASSIAVGRAGAVPSIPTLSEVEESESGGRIS